MLGISGEARPVKDELGCITDCALLSIYKTELHNAVSPEHKELLSYRCLHHFLRNYGNKVASDSFDNFYRATLITSSFWTTRQEYELALDIAMVSADVAIRQNQSNTRIGICFNSVGGQLEANGKYEDAAKLYMQMTTFYFKHSGEVFRGQGYTHAGLAYKYAGDLDLAKQCYVNSWHLVSHLAFEHPSLSSLIHNILVLYNGYMNERKRNFEVSTGEENLYVILCALLKTAGCGRSEYSRTHEEEALRAETSWLKSNLQCRQSALRVLRTAADPPDRDLFRKAILSSAAAGLVCLAYSEGSAKDKADFHTNNAREIGLGCEISLHRCNRCRNNETLAGRPLLQCPCGVAVYCSKECQVSDWKVHKQCCPDLAKKKKQKMKQQQQQERKNIDIDHEIPATFCGNAVQSCNSCTALETPDGGDLLKCPCRTVF